MVILSIPNYSDKIGHQKFYPVLNYISFLDSISAVMSYGVWNKSYKLTIVNILEKINHQPKQKLTDKTDVNKIFENLQSAWINGLALKHSLETSNLKFAHWDIIKFYYTIYSCVSAMSRIACKDIKKENHYQKIKVYNNNILENNFYSKLILPPFNVVLRNGRLFPSPKKITSWEYGQKQHCLEIERGLRFTEAHSKKNVTSIIDFFKYFREWANYKGTYLVKYLYGETCKDQLKRALENISIYFQVMSENFIIKSINFEKVNEVFNDFKKVSEKNLELDSSLIKDRFDIYSTHFKK